MQRRLRTYFLAGLGFLLPIWVAFIFLKGLFYIISGVTRPIFAYIFSKYIPIVDVEALVRLAGFITTIALVFVLGFAVSKILGKAFVGQVDSLFAKIPVIAEIYAAVRKLTAMLASEEGFGKRFRRVVVVEYPKDGIYSMGLVTSEDFVQAEKATGKDLVVVFIPTPPNPVNGLLIMVPREKIIPLEMRVDEAIRIIFSIGLAAS